MTITLHNISKKFVHQYIFKNVNESFEVGNTYAIVGANGSGKSTFLSIVAGFVPPTSGEVRYQLQKEIVVTSEVYKYVALSSPFMELVEEFSLNELVDFHFQFTNFIEGENRNSLVKYMDLEKVANKKIKHFSSGMKQRVKLGLAFFSKKPILLLDEPTVNLDANGVKWYLESVENLTKNKLLIISSNIEAEYFFVNKIINISGFS